MSSRPTGTNETRDAILVVIPVFNRNKMVIEALDRVYNQTLRPSEVIVVDDGSTDETAATVSRWISQHPALNATLIKTANFGASAARNLGFLSRQKPAAFVAFLDSDDLWPADFLERTADRLARNPDAPMAVVDRNFVEVNGSKSNFKSSRAFQDDPFLQLIRMGAGYGSATLLRVSAFESSGGYPEDVPTGHDIIMLGKMITLGQCLHCPGAPVVMRTWLRTRKPDQEPHLHLRYPDRYIRWAETYLKVSQWRSSKAELTSIHELRYHAAIAYRFLLALALEAIRLRPAQMWRIFKDLGRLAALAGTVLGKFFMGRTRGRPHMGE